MPDTCAWVNDAAETGRFSDPVAEGMRLRPRVTPNRRLAWSYGLGAVACLVLALLHPPWSLLFTWPCVGLGMLALAYLDTGAIIFRKRGGRLSLATRLLFGPYLLINAIVYRLLVRRKARYSELTDGVYVGRLLGNGEAAEIIEQGVTAILDLTAEYGECTRFRALSYRNVPILDLTLPTAEQLDEAVEFVGWHAERGRVYIHFALGCFRAPSIAAAHLLASGQVECGAEAIAAVRGVRPQFVVPRGLEELLDRLYGASRAILSR